MGKGGSTGRDGLANEGQTGESERSAWSSKGMGDIERFRIKGSKFWLARA